MEIKQKNHFWKNIHYILIPRHFKSLYVKKQNEKYKKKLQKLMFHSSKDLKKI